MEISMSYVWDLSGTDRQCDSGPSDSLDPLQPFAAGAVGRHPRHRGGRRRRSGAHRGRRPVPSAVESSPLAVARCVAKLRRESGLEAPLVPPGGPHRVLHGECGQRVQLGSAGRTARLPRHPHYQSRTPDFSCARSDESPALSDSRPVLIGETRAQGETRTIDG
jgi:hypothetical protein